MRPLSGCTCLLLVWATQYKYSSDAVLLVLASNWYDPESYIRDYAQFLEIAKARG